MKDNSSEGYLVKIENVQPVRNGYLIVKRVFDLIFAILFAIPASIVILIFCVLIKMDTPGPMFYKQERVGKMGSVIYVTKLRSMYTDAESKSGAVWAKKNDPNCKNKLATKYRDSAQTINRDQMTGTGVMIDGVSYQEMSQDEITVSSK
ncbi:sugar transferase [Lactiplantibacillus plantarum]|uniref:sugar transferase n=1 Tax=Lactiplantibacillus plantarum TaxID=1590 RepID=UPI001E613748|nr:sugar transferase [Lactiplantibacillus plantarum]MCC6120984.1 sugar transferase [Lactiplantibacillus plantarum]MCW6137467.1 sugar transferase [Lactiplantibacillus plantarum]